MEIQPSGLPIQAVHPPVQPSGQMHPLHSVHSTGRPEHPRRKILAAEGFSDQHALHFACALSDFVGLDIAPVARYGIFIHEAITAMNLYRLIGSTFGGLRSK